MIVLSRARQQEERPHMIRHHLLTRSGSLFGGGGGVLSTSLLPPPPSPTPATAPSSPYRGASPSPTTFFINFISSLRGSGETGSPLEHNHWSIQSLAFHRASQD